MKKSLLFLAAGAMLSMASCSNEEVLNSVEGDGNVVFTVSLPGEGYGSRAFSDGLSADKLVYAVYDANSGNLVTTDSKTFGNALSTNVSLTLANGKSYKIAFFAYNPAGEKIYGFNTDDKTITIDYSKMGAEYNANDYDAFYKLEEIETVTGPLQRTVTLTRPFAQVNWGTRDLAEDAVKAEYGDVAANLTTKVTFSEVYGGFNMLDGSMVGDAKSVTFEAAYRPDASKEAFPVQPDTYKYLSMAYILVPAEQRLIDAELTPMAGENENQAVKVSNLPVQANYRTNIYGALLTNPLDFEIVKDQEYETPDYSILHQFAQNGGTFVLSENMNLGGVPLNIPKGVTFTLDLNGNNLDAASLECWGNLVIKGEGTIKAPQAVADKTNPPLVWTRPGATVEILGGHFVGSAIEGVTDQNKNPATIYAQGHRNNEDGTTTDANATVIIRGGVFETSENAILLNEQNNDFSHIIVYGGTFIGQNPADGDDNKKGNFVAEGYESVKVSDSPATWEVRTSLANALANGGTVVYGEGTDANTVVDLSSATSTEPITLKINSAIKSVKLGASSPVVVEVAKDIAYPALVVDNGGTIENLTVVGDITSTVKFNGLDWGGKTIKNVAFDNVPFSGTLRGGYGSLNLDGLTVKNCVFDNMTTPAISIQTPQSAGNIVIENCVINYATESLTGSVDGLYLLDLTGPLTIKNSKISGSNYHGIFVRSKESVEVIGNDVSSARDGIKIEGHLGSTKVVINNNITKAGENGIRVKNPVATAEVSIVGNTIDVTEMIAFDTAENEPWGIYVYNVPDNTECKIVAKDNKKVGTTEHWYQFKDATNPDNNISSPFAN